MRRSIAQMKVWLKRSSNARQMTHNDCRINDDVICCWPSTLFISTTWRSLVCESRCKKKRKKKNFYNEDEKVSQILRTFEIRLLLSIFSSHALIYGSRFDVTWNVINYENAHTSNEALSGNNKHINLRLSLDRFIIFFSFFISDLSAFICVLSFFFRASTATTTTNDRFVLKL